MSVTVTNTDAGTAGKTLVIAETNQTIEGLKTFDRGASAPFAVPSGAAKVSNLDADLLDGEEATDFHDAAQLTGALPAISGASLTNLNASNLATGTVAEARLGSGTGTKYKQLHGDGAWRTAAVAGLCQGRLTLTSGLDETTGDVTAATNIYFTPMDGGVLGLFDGTGWVPYDFTELTIAVPATTDTMYDLFVYDNSGTLTLEAVAWTNDSTRATALAKQNGSYVKSGVLTRLYLGSFRTTGVSGQTEDSFAKRLLWNRYNQRLRLMRVLEATNSWNYSTATWRQANGAVANQLAFVMGIAGAFEAQVRATAIQSAATIAAAVAVGLDSTTAPTTGNIGMGSFVNNTLILALMSSLKVYPAAGYHFAAWLEKDITGGGGGTTTWHGDNNAATEYQSGIHGAIMG